MKFLYVVVISMILFFSTSCSKKTPTHSSVKIQFDSSKFGSALPSSSKISASAAGDLPVWGVPDPTSLSEVNCWGVFVGGPEESFKQNYCKNSAGNDVARFGPRAGFYAFDQSGEVIVPAGNNRKFWLAAMASSTGACPQDFGTCIMKFECKIVWYLASHRHDYSVWILFFIDIKYSLIA